MDDRITYLRLTIAKEKMSEGSKRGHLANPTFLIRIAFEMLCSKVTRNKGQEEGGA